MFSKPLSEPIHLSQDYPCPCDCKGRLVGLALTEAMGCFDCERLFVLVEDGHAIVRPDAHPWTGWRWRWTKAGWYRSSGNWLLSPVGLALLVVSGLLGGGLLCALFPFPRIQLFLGLLGAVVASLLLLVLVMLFSFRPWRE